MGDFIVGLLVLLLVAGAVRILRREQKENGSCAFCSYAKNGSCDHVGHTELDGAAQGRTLTAEQQAILDRHTRKRL